MVFSVWFSPHQSNSVHLGPFNFSVNFNPFSPLQSVQSIVVHFDPFSLFLSIMFISVHFDLFWSNSVHFSLVWSTKVQLVYFNHLQSIRFTLVCLVYFAPLCSFQSIEVNIVPYRLSFFISVNWLIPKPPWFVSF